MIPGQLGDGELGTRRGMGDEGDITDRDVKRLRTHRHPAADLSGREIDDDESLRVTSVTYAYAPLVATLRGRPKPRQTFSTRCWNESTSVTAPARGLVTST